MIIVLITETLTGLILMFPFQSKTRWERERWESAETCWLAAEWWTRPYRTPFLCRNHRLSLLD